MADGFYTIPELCKLLGAGGAKVRHAVSKVEAGEGVKLPRAGMIRLIPKSWLPAIRLAMMEDRRRKPPRPCVRLRLRLID